MLVGRRRLACSQSRGMLLPLVQQLVDKQGQLIIEIIRIYVDRRYLI